MDSNLDLFIEISMHLCALIPLTFFPFIFFFNYNVFPNSFNVFPVYIYFFFQF